MSPLARPPEAEVPPYHKAYVEKAEGEDLLRALQIASDRTWSTVYLIPAGGAELRYAPEKWSIKEVFQHVVDTERVFAYRALRFSRKDPTDLPAFDQGLFVKNAGITERGFHQILREHDVVRTSTIELFRSFNAEMLQQKGKVSGMVISVRALGWVIAGHAMHHMDVIRERYLQKS